jgi:hypothetical protein
MTFLKYLVLLLIFAGASFAQRSLDNLTIYDEAIPRLLKHEQLRYPPLARQAQIEGIVVVKADLDGQGNVVTATAIAGPRLLVPVCLDNIKTWQFSQASNRQSDSVVILYDFRLQGYCLALPCDSTFTFRPRNIAQITSGKLVSDHVPNW